MISIRVNKNFYDEVTAEMVRFYRENPSLAALDLLNVDLHPVQQVILEDCWKKKYTTTVACRGTGKCQTGDTVIPTENGFFEIKDLGNELIPISELNIDIQGINGVEKSSKWYYDGVQPTNKLTTSMGYTIEGTDDHKVITLSEAGELVWKRLEDIKIEDYLVLNRKNKIWSSVDLCTKNEALFFGLLVGDGSFRGNTNNLSFTNGDKDTFDTYVELATSYCEKPPRIDFNRNAWYAYNSGVNHWPKLAQHGLRNGDYSGDKEVPHSVLRSGEKVICSFLKGLFETDGGVERYTVSYTTKSKKLAKQVHILLLALGIVSRLKDKKIKYKNEYRIYNTIEISSNNVDIYAEKIGFLSNRKKISLKNILSKNRNVNKDLVPNQEKLFEAIWNKTRGILPHEKRARLFRFKNGTEKPSYTAILKEYNQYPFEDSLKYSLKCLLDDNYYFDKVVSKDTGLKKVYDLVVPGTHSFVGNGFINHNTWLAGGVIAPLFSILYPGTRVGFISSSFRQARYLFEKAQETYQRSPIFRQACMGEPKRAPDSFRIDLKSVGNIPSGKIEAIPIGTDGAKIRGARYGILAIDEFAQVPKGIFDKVISPMASTSLDPMVAVRLRQKLFKQLQSGLITQEQYETSLGEAKGSVNRIFTFSSGYYQFNHLYERFETQRRLIKEGNKNYAIHQISYREIPEGFLEKEGVENARQTLSSSDFMMEYEGEFVPDSEGVFKASLIESRRNGMANNIWDRTVKLSSESRCVMGVDPARSHDYCAIVIIELGNPNQVVYAWNVRGTDFPSMAKHIHTLYHKFNVTEIYMDKMGGGQAIADILATFDPPLADKDDDLRIGRKVITLVHPSNMETNRSVNDSKSLLEQGKLWFPSSPSVLEKSNSQEEEVYQTIQLMISQLTSIVATSTSTGQVHYDVPGGTKDKDGAKKDLFSAFVLAGKACFDLTERPKEQLSILYPFGFIRNRY